MSNNMYWRLGYNDAEAGRKYNQDQLRNFFDDGGPKWFSDDARDARCEYMEGWDFYAIKKRKLLSYSIEISPAGLNSEFHQLKSLPSLDYVF